MRIAFQHIGAGCYQLTEGGVERPVYVIELLRGRWGIQHAPVKRQATGMDLSLRVFPFKEAKKHAYVNWIEIQLWRDLAHIDALTQEIAYAAIEARNSGVPHSTIESILNGHPEHGSQARTISLLIDLAAMARQGAIVR